MFNTDILFTGYYGQKNTGDDAFVEVASWGAKNIWKKKRNRFIGINSRLPKTIHCSKGYPLSLPKTYSFQKSILLKNTNYLISAGGSTIHSKMTDSSPKSIALKNKQEGNNIKVGGIGVSVGPFKSNEDEKAVKRYLKSIDFLAVRDQKSYDFVSSLDLPYQPVNAFDLAALLPDVYHYDSINKVKSKHKTIGISVCRHESIQGLPLYKEEKRNEMLVQLLKELNKKEKLHFKFFVINGNAKNGDETITKEIIGKVQPRSFEIIDYNRNTQETWSTIAHCNFMLSTRLHGAIFACFAEVPFMLNEYHRKCEDFLETIDYHNPYRLFNSEYDITDKANEILQIIYSPDTYVAPKFVEEMKERAKLNFTSITL